jgi:hypothetical protein
VANKSLFSSFLFLVVSSLSVAAEQQIGWSFDTGLSPEQAREALVANAIGKPPSGSWLRLRGIEQWADDGRQKAEDGRRTADDKGRERIRKHREDLAALRSAGFRLVAFVRWSPESWKGGVRTTGVRQNRLPQDLRDACERCRYLANTYGDLIDYWEIDNEPDISFVQENPETYAAFLKACWLGIAAGRREPSQQLLDEGSRMSVDGKNAESRNAETLKQDRSQLLDAGPRMTELSAESSRLSVDRKNAENRKAEKLKAEANVEPITSNQSPNNQSALTTRETSRVLMAPLALPPGPYFEAFVRNDGLRYTDGFNYHYYGYAEDFSGMYRQFETATRELQVEFSRAWPAEMPDNAAVFRTQFFPSADGWRGEITAGFGHSAENATERAKALLSRPRAIEERAEKPFGRWLLTDGMSVEELPDGWRFRIERWPAGGLRSPTAELPLPPRWTPGKESLVSFEYRTVPIGASSFTPTNAEMRNPEKLKQDAERGGRNTELLGERYQLLEQPRTNNSYPITARDARTWPARDLPIFLTEYGYGSLDKITRHTAEGRERQRRFFSSVTDQIKQLGIEGAMAFLLAPYLENDLIEFGLLMNAESGPAPGTARVSQQGWGKYTVSPALEELLNRAGESFPPKRWRIQAPNPSPVVIDFIAGKGLGMAKSYSGYFLEGGAGRAFPGQGDLVVYNFSDKTVAGTLKLEGAAWRIAPKAEQLSDGSYLLSGKRALVLELKPMERRVIPVEIMSTVKRFIGEPVTAWFRPFSDEETQRYRDELSRRLEVAAAAARSTSATAQPANNPQQVTDNRPPPPREAPMPKPGQPVHTFEMYFRTENGNLYQTWPRLVPTENWQVYMQRVENFTPAFYGRLNLPWRFLDNKPASLVVRFHPQAFPAVFEVRRAQMVRFFAPEAR